MNCSVWRVGAVDAARVRIVPHALGFRVRVPAKRSVRPHKNLLRQKNGYCSWTARLIYPATLGLGDRL